MNRAPVQARRIELVLQQLDALPTLSAIAARVIQLTTSEDARAEEIIRLISSDPSLSSRVLKLCRCTDRVRAGSITTVERAVLHLGFDAVRSAVLSVEIFELFDSVKSPAGEVRGDDPVFDREAFWHHSLAVAVLCEHFARTPALRTKLKAGEAFLAGLLHDLGLLAIHVLLPHTLDRVCRSAETGQMSINQACAKLIGLTTHIAGKRLAERWHLPRAIGDVMWLHGQSHNSLPDLPHRALIDLVTLADAIARARYISPVGHMPRGEDIGTQAQGLDLTTAAVRHAIEALPGDVRERAESLGLDVRPDHEMLLHLISQANQSLGRMNSTLRRQAGAAKRQMDTLRTVVEFHESHEPGDTLVTVLEKVVRSAQSHFGAGYYAVLYQNNAADPWRLVQFLSDGHSLRSDVISPPPGAAALHELADSSQMSMQTMAMLPWLSDYLGDAEDVRNVRLLPLRCGWGVCAVLLHDRPPNATERLDQDALSWTWGAAIAAGVQHEGARMLGEELAEANRMLIEAQDELTRTQAMAALGEVVAGAAHEMNNPLTIISGRSQQLVDRIHDPELHVMAEQIVAQSHRLSDMITSLRSFSEPLDVQRRATDFRDMLMRVLSRFRPGERDQYDISTVIADELPAVWVDPDPFSEAVAELLRNAVESKGSQHIEVRVQTDPLDGRLRIRVRDDGAGLSDHALAHAFDPFYSAKPAGRQPGLGLSRARRIIEAHGGRITLENAPKGGAVATIWLEEWRGDGTEQREAA